MSVSITHLDIGLPVVEGMYWFSQSFRSFASCSMRFTWCVPAFVSALHAPKVLLGKVLNNPWAISIPPPPPTCSSLSKWSPIPMASAAAARSGFNQCALFGLVVIEVRRRILTNFHCVELYIYQQDYGKHRANDFVICAKWNGIDFIASMQWKERTDETRQDTTQFKPHLM